MIFVIVVENRYNGEAWQQHGNSVITDLNNLGVTEECNRGEAKSTQLIERRECPYSGMRLYIHSHVLIVYERIQLITDFLKLISLFLYFSLHENNNFAELLKNLVRFENNSVKQSN